MQDRKHLPSTDALSKKQRIRRTGDELVSKAKADAENEKAAAMQQADAAVRDMVVTAAARMVAMKDAKESDRALYDKFLAETKEA